MDSLWQVLTMISSFLGYEFASGIIVAIGGLYFGPDRLNAFLARSKQVAKVIHETLDEAQDEIDKSE